MKRLLVKALKGRHTARHDPARRIGLREIHPADTFIVSFPKSGNTWVRFLIASMRHPAEEISFRNIEQLVPDIHKSRSSIDTMVPPRTIKSHFPCFGAYPRFVYVYRDGRDAMISYHEYSVSRGWFDGTLREFLSSEVAHTYGSWARHTTDAMKQMEKSPERALAVRYEDLLASPQEEAGRIARFCGLNADPDRVAQAVERCRLSRLREMERRHGGEIEDSNFTFFPHGSSGRWRTGTLPEQLAAFSAESKHALKALGYAG
jgi:estrone sulfotransferase